ncbi:MAG: class II glutamine amidotransferase [Candidatus Bipolaricaulia bacterium]
MCRLLAKLTLKPEPARYELIEAPFSLRNLSRSGDRFNKPRGPHPHGWGLAYRKDGEMLIEKSPKPAFEDERFAQLAGEIETDLLLGHVRLASPGTAIDLANTHPFKRDGLTLIHNGTIRRIAPPGENDSEAFLEWLTVRWDHSEAGLIELLQEAITAFDYTALNLILTDGARLFALRQTLNEPEHLRYYTLYYLRESARLLISSEPIDEREWKPLGNGCLLSATAPGGMTIKSLAPQAS